MEKGCLAICHTTVKLRWYPVVKSHRIELECAFWEPNLDPIFVENVSKMFQTDRWCDGRWVRFTTARAVLKRPALTAHGPSLGHTDPWLFWAFWIAQWSWPSVYLISFVQYQWDASDASGKKMVLWCVWLWLSELTHDGTLWGWVVKPKFEVPFGKQTISRITILAILLNRKLIYKMVDFPSLFSWADIPEFQDDGDGATGHAALLKFASSSSAKAVAFLFWLCIGPEWKRY